MATYSSILAWRISGTEKPGGLRSIESQSQTRLKQLSTHAHTSSERPSLTTLYEIAVYTPPHPLSPHLLYFPLYF